MCRHWKASAVVKISKILKVSLLACGERVQGLGEERRGIITLLPLPFTKPKTSLRFGRRERSSNPPLPYHPPMLMCVTIRTLCLLVISVPAILSVTRAVIHDTLLLMVHQGCDPFKFIPQSHKKWSSCRCLISIWQRSRDTIRTRI